MSGFSPRTKGARGRFVGDWEQAVELVISGKTRRRSDGYVLVFLPMHPGANPSYVYEHRIVMERVLGRFLTTGEHVHHRNGDHADNRPENLELLTPSEHRLKHSGVTDAEVAGLIRRGVPSRAIVRELGVGQHRVVRVRREIAEARA